MGDDEERGDPQRDQEGHSDVDVPGNAGAEAERSGNGGGASVSGMDDGGSQPAQGDGRTGIDVGSITYERSAPLPMVNEFAGYERILPGAADRIVSMAERSLDSQIEDAKAARSVEAADHRAGNASMIIASVAFSFLPWVAFITAAVCAVVGSNTAAIFSGVIGIVSAGPQVIGAIKKKRG